MLVASRGGVPIARIAHEVSWSHKHLIARFRQQVGLTPKTIARRVRIQHVLARIGAGRKIRWSEVPVDGDGSVRRPGPTW